MPDFADPYEIFWPHIAGEKFAPDLGGVYSTYLGRPTIKYSSTGNFCRWRDSPRTSPRDQSGTTLKITIFLASVGRGAAGATDTFVFSYGTPGVGAVGPPPGVRIVINKPSVSPMSVDTETCDNTNGAIEKNAGAASISDTLWHQFIIVLTDTSTTFTMDGTLIATHTVRLWPNGVGAQGASSSSILQPEANLNVPGGNPSVCHSAALRMTYDF